MEMNDFAIFWIFSSTNHFVQYESCENVWLPLRWEMSMVFPG